MDLQRLFDTHGAFIARAIERLTGAGPHVDDLLQETFMIAFKNAHRFDADKAEAASWLYGIAVNLSRRYGRSRSRALRFVTRFAQYTALESKVAGPEKTMIQQETVQTVRRAIEKLPFKQREVFILFELEGMEGKDISALLNVKEGTVWTRLHHARKAFKKHVRKRAALYG